MKLSRRDFLKFVSVLGLIAPIFDIENIKANLSDFSLEQLKAVSDIKSIEKSAWGPYYLPKSADYAFYDIELKDGTKLQLDTDEIKERYGGILPYLIEHSKPDLRPDNYNAVWNS